MGSRRRHSLGSIGLAAMMLCVIAVPSARAVTLLLKSATIPAYDSAALGCRSMLHTPCVEISMSDCPAVDLPRRLEEIHADAVVAIGARAAESAHTLLPNTPLVFCLVRDPDEHGLTGPGITGITYAISPRNELTALKRTAPSVKRVALVHTSQVSPDYLSAALAAAGALDVDLVDCLVSDEADMSEQTRHCLTGVDAVWLPPDPSLSQPEPFRFLVQVCVEERKPLLVFSESLVRGGALMAVAPDYFAVGVQASEIVRRLQAGDAVDSIPVAPARRTRLVFNESTGRAIGLLRAPRVLQAEIVR